ncbi:MAG: hypothetical protein JOZ39_06120 [Chloroflexi bacterium]|nr:hypothetical protein [Chloroflexota bacterium]
MAIRPIDLQQAVVKSTDVTREASQQQQLAAAAQDNIAKRLELRHAQKTETVQQFDETGEAAVHERDARSGGDPRQQERQAQGQTAGNAAAQQNIQAKDGNPRPRVGRHVDMQA